MLQGKPLSGNIPGEVAVSPMLIVRNACSYGSLTSVDKVAQSHLRSHSDVGSPGCGTGCGSCRGDRIVESDHAGRPILYPERLEQRVLLAYVSEIEPNDALSARHRSESHPGSQRKRVLYGARDRLDRARRRTSITGASRPRRATTSRSPATAPPRAPPRSTSSSATAPTRS